MNLGLDSVVVAMVLGHQLTITFWIMGLIFIGIELWKVYKQLNRIR